MVRPEQSYELGPDAPHRYGLPSWALAKATARGAAPGGGPGPPDEPHDMRLRAAARARAARSAASRRSSAWRRSRSWRRRSATTARRSWRARRLREGRWAGSRDSAPAATPLDPVDCGPVGPHDLLLVLGGDQGVVDAVGAEQLAQGRGCPAGVDRPQPPSDHLPGGRAAGGGPPPPAGGSWPARCGSGPGPREPRLRLRTGSSGIRPEYFVRKG